MGAQVSLPQQRSFQGQVNSIHSTNNWNSQFQRLRGSNKLEFDHHGKFYVVGGYDTAKQGQFQKSAEAFDLSTWRWGLRKDDFLRNDTCPRTCVDGGDGVMYMHHDGAVVALNHDFRMRIPSDIDNVPCLIGWDRRLLAVGCDGSSGRHGVYMLDLESSTWTKVEVPEEYSGHVQFGCCLEI